MNTNNTTATKRAGLAAALLAAAALGILGNPAIANAERELDMGVWEECYNNIPWTYSPPEWDNAKFVCCIKAGGDWNEKDKTCEAPPAVSPDGSIDPQPQDPRSGTYKPPQGPVVTAP